MAGEEQIQNSLQAIEEGKQNFSEDEQNIITAWIAKISQPKETEEENAIRNEYARTLARLTTEEKQLLPPFTEMPGDGDLPPLSGPKKKLSMPVWKMPCSNTPGRRQSSLSPKSRRRERSLPLNVSEDNEFEDFEEMARVIAQSKGQTFAEFVMTISRYTADSGQALRTAMKAETTYFKEYVDRILTQRIKDVTQLLDEEHNSELQRIKKDIDKWELELAHCKKRIKELVPDFDLEMYRKDKKYLKKVFAPEVSGTVRIDGLQRYIEDVSVQTQIFTHYGMKACKCNEVLTKNIEDLKEKIMNLEAAEKMKQENHVKEMNCDIAEYQKLKEERDLLHKEIMDTVHQLQQRAERNRITLWMKKIMKNNKSLSDLRLRNEFLEYLAVMVQDGELQPPFNQDPPRAALKTLTRHLPGRDESSTQDDESMAMLRFLPAKHGGFLLPKPLPQIGAYCYIAASGQMECKKE